MTGAHTIAIVGMGPRGLSVLERIAIRAADRPGRPVVVYVIDRVEVGAGRVWRTDQPDWFTMNTVAGQVTMYSGGRDDGPDRAGAGPSLSEWTTERSDTPTVGPDGYASRRAYGRYLRATYQSIVDWLPDGMTVREVVDQVVAVDRVDGRFRLAFGKAGPITVDQVVLATGHPVAEPASETRALADAAATTPGLTFLSGDSAADLDLDAIPPGASVGVLGMGLACYDVLVALTIGRGGTFTESGYVRSGREPRIVAGSRGGVPILARGRNQKPPDHVHRPVVFTAARARAARTDMDGPDAPLDFLQHVMPLIQAEVDHVYLRALVAERQGPDRAAAFAERHGRLLIAGLPTAALLSEFGVADPGTLDLRSLARPFRGRRFGSREEFRETLLELMREDVEHAHRGNADGPVKAALDVLRDIRNTIRDLVDYGGLRVASHRDDFLGWYVPVNALLSAGPPIERVQQLIALVEAGVVEVIGPRARFTASNGRFLVSSPDVVGAEVPVETVIDARIPQPDLRRDTSPLYAQLRADGLVREYVETDPHDTFPTGGVETTRAPFGVVDRSGSVVLGLHALGLPTEHLRWFTQVGSGRPGMRTLFLRDADSIAEAVLSPAGSLTALAG